MGAIPFPSIRPRSVWRWRSAAILLMSAAWVVLATANGFAVEATEMLANPKLEARARGLSTQFRCLVCQNELIDEFNAQLAHDLRVLIREQVSEGKSDSQIRDFLIARYGQFILLKPRLTRETLLLWLGPLGILVLGAGVILAVACRRASASDAPLSAEERRRLAELQVELRQPDPTPLRDEPRG